MSKPLLWQVTPPPARCIGGLTPAIEGMDRMAAAHGWEVERQQGNIPRNPGTLPQLVHFHGLWEFSHQRISRWCRRGRIPYLVSPHGMLEPWALRHRGWKKSIYLRLLERSHLERARALVTTSDLEAANVRRLLPKAHIQVAPLGMNSPPDLDRVAVRNSLGVPAGQTLLLYLSRIDPKKGLHHLLNALATLPSSQTRDWRLAVVGPLDTAHARDCQALATGLAGRLPKIDWIGPVWGDQRFNWLRAADLFLLPTHSENFGLVVLESLMVGTPVVTTRHTPWADLADEPGIHLVEPSPESVAAFLHAGVAPWPAASRERLVDWTRARFTWEALVPAYSDIYRTDPGPTISRSDELQGS